MKIYLFTTLAILFLALNAQETFYVDESNPGTDPNGTKENPFRSLEEAISKLQVGSYEIILMGEQASIPNPLFIPDGSDYEIIGQPSSPDNKYFPLIFGATGSFEVTQANLTLKGVKLIETDRDPNIAARVNFANGNLILDTILIEDLNYTYLYYLIVYISGYDAKGVIKNSEFRNLTDVYISSSAAKFTVTGCTFTEITQSMIDLFLVVTSPDSIVEVIFQNNTVNKLIFAPVDGNLPNFINVYVIPGDHVDSPLLYVTIEDLTVKDSIMMSDCHFLSLDANAAIQDTDAAGNDTPMEIKLKNWVIENVEQGEDPVSDPTEFGRGLVVQVSGNITVSLESFKLKNIYFMTGGLFSNFYNLTNRGEDIQNITLSTTSIKDISIDNGTNVNFMVVASDVTLENVNMIRPPPNEVQIPGQIAAQFFFRDTDRAFIRNITGVNHVGPMFRINNITIVDIIDCKFTGITIATNFTTQNQVFLELIRLYNTTCSGKYIPEENIITNVHNFNVDGCMNLGGLNGLVEVNASAMILLRVPAGKVFFKDSVWRNVDLTGILARSAKFVQLDNMTMSTDPSRPQDEIIRHKLIHVRNIEEFRIFNSVFVTNLKANILELYSISGGEYFDEISLTTIILDNVMVLNNNITFSDVRSLVPTLINLYSPIKPAIFVCNNSVFQGNQVSQGLIMVEAFEINVTLLNNTFQDNYAEGTGTIYSSDTMQETFNRLDIKDNTFTNNKCLGNGGLFSFISSKHQITAINNIYKGNSAGGSGGVGYVSKSKLILSETDGKYLDNSAGLFGGSWYFDVNRNQNKEIMVTFSNVVFERSTALKSGGAIYIARGDVSLTDSLFQDNSAKEAGGDIYLLTLCSLQVDRTKFTGNSARHGSWIFAEALSGETIALNNIQVENINSVEPDTFLVRFSYGTIVISNAQFQSIQGSLFSFDTSSIAITNTAINDITCYSQNSPCIVYGKGSSIKISDSEIQQVSCFSDLIAMDSVNGKMNLVNVKVMNVNKLNTTSQSIFAINTNSALSIQRSQFSNIPFTSINMKTNILEIQNTIFSNAIEERLLQEAWNIGATQEGNKFIVLGSSNSIISNSVFENNMMDFQSDGGAIEILGSKGNHSISNSHFQGNRALNGGAISVKGSLENLEIVFSEFSDNEALGKGGCLFFDDKSIVGSINLIQNSFRDNSAQKAGCIYFGNINASIQGSTFENNKAEQEGGAIVSVATDGQTAVLIEGSNFIGNKAWVGSALMAFGYLNFRTPASLFSDNIAGFGSYIATNPFYLRLQIYEFDETYLFLQNITPELLKSDPTTKVVFDSFDPTLRNTLVQKSGRPPRYLLEFILLDQLYNEAAPVKNLELTVNVNDSQSPTSVQPAFIGSSFYPYKQTEAVFFIYNSLTIRGSTGTTMTLGTTASYENTLNNNREYLPTVEWEVIIGPCTQGEIYDKTNIMCISCPEDTYSLQDNLESADQCTHCSRLLICKGENVVLPQRGYWKMDKASDNIIDCLKEEACLGGEIDNGTKASFTGFCNEGYEGIGCGSCRPGYAKFGRGQKCANCQTDGFYYFKFAAFFLIQIALITYTVKIYVLSANPDITDQDFVLLKAALIKILIDFAHVVNLITEFNFRWPDIVDVFLDVLTKLMPNSRDALSIDCFIALIKGNNRGVFFVKLLVLMLQPLIFILISVGIWAVIYKIQRKHILNPATKFRATIILTGIIIIYILQPNIVSAAFHLFNCKDYGPSYSPAYYMVEDTTVECWTSEHLAWSLGLGLPILIIWLVVPTGIFTFLLMKDKKTTSETFLKKYNYIFARYNPGCHYWEIVIFARKVILILLAVFVKTEFIQAYLGLFTLMTAFSLQARIQPFSGLELNVGEELSIFSSSCIFYSGLFFVRVREFTTISALLFSADTMAGLIFFGYYLYLTQKLIRKKLQALKRSLSVVVQSETYTNLGPQIMRSIRKRFSSKKSSKGTDQLGQDTRQIDDLQLMRASSCINLDQIPTVRKRYRRKTKKAKTLEASHFALSKSRLPERKRSKDDFELLSNFNNEIMKRSEPSRDRDEEIVVDDDTKIIRLQDIQPELSEEEDQEYINLTQVMTLNHLDEITNEEPNEPSSKDQLKGLESKDSLS